MTVYDPQGQPVDMDAVDARECVKHCGYTYEPSPETKPALKPKLDKKQD